MSSEIISGVSERGKMRFETWRWSSEPRTVEGGGVYNGGAIKPLTVILTEANPAKKEQSTKIQTLQIYNFCMRI